MTSSPDPRWLTPVQRAGDIWLKRDDLYEPMVGHRGGKVRTCLWLATMAHENGQGGLVTAGSRHSPQVPMVAAAGRLLNMPVTAYVPAGQLSAELMQAIALGAQLEHVTPGYNTVLVARARAHARATADTEIPFGMECQEAVEFTAAQVANVPSRVQRIVVPVGSGMSLAGILTGLAQLGRDTPVLGVMVGADPARRLARWAPLGWQTQTQLVDAWVGYAKRVTATLHGVHLDPVYEAKCVRYLQPGDLLWLVGHRA